MGSYKIAFICCLLILGLVITELPGFCQKGTKPISPFSDFISPNVNDYATYQFKITYLGPQLKVVPTLAFYDPVHTTWDISKFVPYERNEIDYGNDYIHIQLFSITPQEMKTFVLKIAMYPELTDTSSIPDPYISFMILRDPGTAQEKAFEGLMTKEETQELLYLLHESLDWSNTDGISLVTRYRVILHVF